MLSSLSNGLRTTVRAIPILVIALSAASALAQPVSPPVAFTDTSAALGGFVHGGGTGDGLVGVAWFDHDGDGWLDLYIANGIGFADALLRNNGDGTFTDIGADAGIADLNGSSSVAAADLDNDGDPDLVVVGDNGAFSFSAVPATRPIRLFENQGDGTYADVTVAAGFGVIPPGPSALMVSLGDIDNDGLLDVFVTGSGSVRLPGDPTFPNHLFHNQGGLRFAEIGAASGLGYIGAACVSTFSHYDDDAWIDLFVGDCNIVRPDPEVGLLFVPTPFRLYRNNGDLTFTRLEGLGLPSPDGSGNPDERGFWMCVGIGDFDNDLDFDVFSTNVGVTGPFVQPHILLERQDNGTFESVEDAAGITDAAPEWGWGCSFADFNNDGWEDLMLVGNLPPTGVLTNPGHLFFNRGDGTFRREPLPADLTLRYDSGLAVADYDHDGDVDAVVGIGGIPMIPDLPMVPDSPLLLRNEGNGNTSLAVRLRGTVSNRDAVGARVYVLAEGRQRVKETHAGSSFASQNSLWPSFGLGTATSATVDVVWPSGDRNRLHDVEAGTTTFFPELPCSIDDPETSFQTYRTCVNDALAGLVEEGVLDNGETGRFRASAFRAWQEEHLVLALSDGRK